MFKKNKYFSVHAAIRRMQYSGVYIIFTVKIEDPF